eukprot:TRINITY_DN21427_c0_g1_i1.p1 TRINITY_DN21427_c0_g1~~TRINITY_DN21427_c0_g1_i1.p1  ORF type:complete len:451 (-),score=73.50 TRINITY_DN21427_c0_g1_i1:188-1540(-)
MSDSFVPGSLLSALLLRRNVSLDHTSEPIIEELDENGFPVCHSGVQDEKLDQEEMIETTVAKPKLLAVPKASRFTADADTDGLGVAELNDHRDDHNSFSGNRAALLSYAKKRLRGSLAAFGDEPEKSKPSPSTGSTGLSIYKPAIPVKAKPMSKSPPCSASASFAQALAPGKVFSSRPSAVWERAVDRQRNAVYYWNHCEGRASWSPPPPSLGWWERLWSQSDSLEFFWNSVTRETLWHLPLPEGKFKSQSTQSLTSSSPAVTAPMAKVAPSASPPVGQSKVAVKEELLDGTEVSLGSVAGVGVGINQRVPHALYPPPPKARPVSRQKLEHERAEAQSASMSEGDVRIGVSVMTPKMPPSNLPHTGVWDDGHSEDYELVMTEDMHEGASASNTEDDNTAGWEEANVNSWGSDFEEGEGVRCDLRKRSREELEESSDEEGVLQFPPSSKPL